MLVLKPSFGTPSGTLASLKQQFSCFRHGGEASLRTLIRRGVSCVGCCERIWAQNLQRVFRSNECGHEQRASRKLLSLVLVSSSAVLSKRVLPMAGDPVRSKRRIYAATYLASSSCLPVQRTPVQ